MLKQDMRTNRVISQRGNRGEKHKFTNELPVILPSLGAISARLQRPSLTQLRLKVIFRGCILSLQTHLTDNELNRSAQRGGRQGREGEGEGGGRRIARRAHYGARRAR